MQVSIPFIVCTHLYSAMYLRFLCDKWGLTLIYCYEIFIEIYDHKKLTPYENPHSTSEYKTPWIFISPIYFLGSTDLNHPANANKNSKLSSLQPVSSKSLRDEGWGSWNDKLGVPYFVANQTHLVLAPLDHTTYLHCIVGNLGDRQVH